MIGLVCLEHILAEDGWTVANLGADLPAADLGTFVARNEVAIVCLSALDRGAWAPGRGGEGGQGREAPAIPVIVGRADRRGARPRERRWAPTASVHRSPRRSPGAEPSPRVLSRVATRAAGRPRSDGDRLPVLPEHLAQHAALLAEGRVAPRRTG